MEVYFKDLTCRHGWFSLIFGALRCLSPRWGCLSSMAISDSSFMLVWTTGIAVVFKSLTSRHLCGRPGFQLQPGPAVTFVGIVGWTCGWEIFPSVCCSAYQKKKSNLYIYIQINIYLCARFRNCMHVFTPIYIYLLLK